MKSAEFYRHLAAITRRTARGSTDPALIEQLNREAQEYDDMAYRIDRQYLATAEMAHEDTRLPSE